MMIVNLLGHLGSEPEVTVTPTGRKVTRLRLAVKHRKGKDREDVTVWWSISVWGDQYDGMMPYLHSGSAVMIIGELSPPETYTDKAGQQRVGMHCTAKHLSFVSLGGGKGDRKNNEGAEDMGEMQLAAAGVASSAHSSYSGHTSAYSDEVPF